MRVIRDTTPVSVGIEIRVATAGDGAAAGALCGRVPVVGPHGFAWIDHGDCWWGAVGNRPGRRVFVAERDGVVVGLDAVAVHDARLDGRMIRLALCGPTRIDPSVQGSGVFRALRSAVAAVAADDAAELYALIPVGEPPRRLPHLLRRWPVRIHRSVIDCRRVADPAVDARRADPSDAADLIARTRHDAVLAPLQDRVAIEQRFVAGPDYGIDRVLTNGDAVLGVARWCATRRDDRTESARRQATAWDVGATSAASLEALVRAWCARLADDGVDDLVVWSCRGDVVDDAVASLATATTAHVVDLGLTPPPGTASRAVHVDASLL